MIIAVVCTVAVVSCVNAVTEFNAPKISRETGPDWMYVDTRGHCWVDKIEMAALWGKANACSVFGRLVISITQKNEMTQYSGRQTKRTNVTAKYTDNAQNSVTTKAQVIVTNEMHGSNNCSECIALPCWRVTYFF